MLKATIASVLALSAVVSLTGCEKKSQEASAPAAAAQAPGDTLNRTMPEGVEHPAVNPSAQVDVTGVAKAEGGQTVAEVYAGKDALAGKPVTVRGKVVKLNTGIMGSNWLHVRDGSGAEGTNDLTVTTKSTTMPKVGDTVVITGVVVLDKDFGMGYQYPVIVEDAEVKVE